MLASGGGCLAKISEWQMLRVPWKKNFINFSAVSQSNKGSNTNRKIFVPPEGYGEPWNRLKTVATAAFFCR